MMSPVRTARWMALASLILSTGRTAAPAATFTVTTTADSGAGSLRQALADANGNPGADTIVFAIPGSGVHTIDVLSNLPIADDVVIDGYSQPGSSPNTDSLASNAVILIDLQGSDTDGFEVSAGRADIRGLALHGFDGAIHLSSASGSLISGCFIGLLPNGSSAPGSAIGIFTQSGTADTIGDGSPANRNVISGNDIGLQIDGGGQTIVRGNLIGTNAAGSARLSNGTGVVVSSSVSLGGSTAGQGNVISGNTGDGVKIDAASGADVFGNIVGLDATGLQPLGNGGIGINVDADLPHLAGNVISANGAHGIDLTNSSNATVESNIIGLDVNEQGELGNAGAGVHVYTGFEVVVGSQNTIAHNGAGVWMETPTSPYDIRVFDNSIFENGGLGIVDGPSVPAVHANGVGTPFPLITSVFPNGSTTTVNGVYHGFANATILILPFLSPACSKKRPWQFDEGKTAYSGVFIATDGSGSSPFSLDLPVVVTDEVVTASAMYMSCPPPCLPPLADGGSEYTISSQFSQRLPYAIDPSSGSPAGGDAITIVGTNFGPGATVTVGNVVLGSANVVGPTEIDITAPALAPGVAHDVSVMNSDGTHGTIPLAWLADFLDVPQAHPFHGYVRDTVTNSVATGVGGGNFGVAASTLRQQMAVFLLKAKHGICYTPPPCTGIFADVPCPSLFADWIEALAAEGITGGCGGGKYCPTAAVRRDQMAAFLLKAEHGSTYVPPPCMGAFADVACPSLFADWIEQLAAEQVTGGCGGGNYCPSSPNTRGQMAVFLTKTFKLQ